MIPNFEWDLAKARENLRKHGVSFEEAASVFGDGDAIVDGDPKHSENEDRLIIIGVSARDRTLLTVFTFRDENLVRIISSRRAVARERRAYEENRQSRRG